MIDPRISVIDTRLERIGRIIAVAGGKGGVGKSACAAVTALELARGGKRVGLLDADFTGSSAHIFLGAELRFPAEDRGITPPQAGFGLRFMSAASFAGERGLALRGAELTDVFLELFAITRWEELDYLFIDMPPGLGDEVLDLIRYVRRVEALLVTTPSVVSAKVVARLRRLLEERGVPVIGLIENMSGRGESSANGVPEEPRLAAVPYSTELEAAVGRPEALLKTDFAQALRPAVHSLTGSRPNAAGGR